MKRRDCRMYRRAEALNEWNGEGVFADVWKPIVEEHAKSVAAQAAKAKQPAKRAKR